MHITPLEKRLMIHWYCLWLKISLRCPLSTRNSRHILFWKTVRRKKRRITLAIKFTLALIMQTGRPDRCFLSRSYGPRQRRTNEKESLTWDIRMASSDSDSSNDSTKLSRLANTWKKKKKRINGLIITTRVKYRIFRRCGKWVMDLFERDEVIVLSVIWFRWKFTGNVVYIYFTDGI